MKAVVSCMSCSSFISILLYVSEGREATVNGEMRIWTGSIIYMNNTLLY